MTQEEIMEGNELIAKFLEWFQEDKEPHTWYIKSDNCIVVAYSTWKDQFKQLPFHKEWNWLMKVIEKIEAIKWIPPGGDDENWFVVNINGDQCSVDRETDNSIRTIINNFLGDKPKIERVYEVVVDFIRWYNKE